MSNPHIGGSFDEFLEEEGVREEVEALALKRVIAWQMREAMKRGGINKVELARRMGTSRTQVDRLLDPENTKVQLDTLQRAAHALGGALRLELVEVSGKSRASMLRREIDRGLKELDAGKGVEGETAVERVLKGLGSAG